MNQREKDIIHVALIYMMANLTDVQEAFSGEKGNMKFCGKSIPPIEEPEIESLLKQMWI